MFSGDDKVFF